MHFCRTDDLLSCVLYLLFLNHFNFTFVTLSDIPSHRFYQRHEAYLFYFNLFTQYYFGLETIACVKIGQCKHKVINLLYTM